MIQFFGVCELPEQNSPALVMEFAFGGPLNAVLRHHPVLSPSTLLTWSIQIATGMAYLHSDAKLVHRDLKSANSKCLSMLILSYCIRRVSIRARRSLMPGVLGIFGEWISGAIITILFRGQRLSGPQ